MHARFQAEENEMRVMRLALREICMRLGTDKRFRTWSAPIDAKTEEGEPPSPDLLTTTHPPSTESHPCPRHPTQARNM